MRRQLSAALRAILVLTLLVGVVYPLTVMLVGRLAFSDAAEGSLLHHDGRVVGSRLIGQAFEGDQWFHPRPSSAGDGYDAMASSPSNLGPGNPELLDAVAERVAAYRRENHLGATVSVPGDAVTGSGSGLDPHISPANARIQVARVAEARGLTVAQVRGLVEDHVATTPLGLAPDTVNVLELNLALDDLR